jgi:hypothetical protein
VEGSGVDPATRRRSTVRVVPPIRPRKLAKVPFLELADGRLQGVVSSGSDIERVYVSSISARAAGPGGSARAAGPGGSARAAGPGGSARAAGPGGSARDHTFSCSTNNNRPCGGLSGSPCKHLRSLVDEAVVQYGVERVARYLRVSVDEAAATGADVVAALSGRPEPAAAATVFSRFLHHLSYLELPDVTEPVPELHWFPAGRAAT